MGGAASEVKKRPWEMAGNLTGPKAQAPHIERANHLPATRPAEFALDTHLT
jgi:hypothetical protein